MSILDNIRADIKTITENDEDFAVEITFTAPDLTVAVINGLHTKHHMSINTEGQMVNSKNTHISFSEASLPLAYPLRNAAGEVNLKRHKISVKDSTGIVKNYTVAEWFPDETVGLIVCLLNDRE